MGGFPMPTTKTYFNKISNSNPIYTDGRATMSAPYQPYSKNVGDGPTTIGTSGVRVSSDIVSGIINPS